MKAMTRKLLALASATLALPLLSGCWTPMTQLPPTDSANPPKNWLVMETAKDAAVLQLRSEGMSPDPALAKARVILVDRSYRLLVLMFEDRHTQTFKVALPDTMQNVSRGDYALVREWKEPASGT